MSAGGEWWWYHGGRLALVLQRDGGFLFGPDVRRERDIKKEDHPLTDDHDGNRRERA